MSPINIAIRPITSSKMLEPCAQLLTDAYNGPPWNDQWTKEKAFEKLSCFYNSPKFLGWVVLIDNFPVGACVGNIEPYYAGDYFYLKEMFVSPAHQKKKIGNVLLHVVKQYLKKVGIHTIILFTGKDHYPFDFYLKSGFSEMEGMRMMHFE